MKPGKRRRSPSFVGIERSVLKSAAWRELGNAARVLYLHLKAKYDGKNNGDIKLYYSEMKGVMATATLSKAFKELEQRGWIEKTKYGGRYRFVCSYRLTGTHERAFIF